MINEYYVQVRNNDKDGPGSTALYEYQFNDDGTAHCQLVLEKY